MTIGRPCLLAVVVIVAGCGTGAGAGASPVGDAEPSTAAVALPSVSPSLSPNPSPTASAADRAASTYHAAMSRYVAAVEGAGPDCARQTIPAQRRCFDIALTALGRFESQVRAIDFPAELDHQADALLTRAAALRDLLTSARAEAALDRLVDQWWPQIDPADVAVLDAANQLRAALGLPPIASD
jgi:hypothetical protein